MLYRRLGLPDGKLCAAVARAVVHDVAVNGPGLGGFPEIAAHATEHGFTITLRIRGHKRSFDVTDTEAFRMVAKLNGDEQHDEGVFDRIEEAITQLEEAVVSRVARRTP